jgi:hypothetical protein
MRKLTCLFLVAMSAAVCLGSREITEKDVVRNKLAMAISRGDVDTVKKLIEAGIDVNYDSHDYTLLTTATTVENADIARTLIAAGANVNAKSKTGYTALMSAVMGNVGVTKVLIEAGADVNAQNNQGVTVLQMAVYNGNTEIVRMLAEAGADVNIKHENARADHGHRPGPLRGYVVRVVVPVCQPVRHLLKPERVSHGGGAAVTAGVRVGAPVHCAGVARGLARADTL